MGALPSLSIPGLAELDPKYHTLELKHGHTMTMRVFSYELGSTIIHPKHSPTPVVKRAIGLVAQRLDKPGPIRDYKITWQPVIDLIVPTLQQAAGAPVDLTLKAYGYKQRLNFSVEVDA